MTETRTIKVAIVEDLRDIREGLAQLLNATPGYRCIGVYGSMEEALAKIPHNLPDIVLSDIGLPGMDGISGIAILKQRSPELLILMLTVYDDNERIFDALCAGACGYLLKKTPWVKLVEALKEAVEGGSPMSPEVARRVINLFREIKPPKEATYELTPHEVRLLRMLVEGHSYKTAANELHVSVNTIKFHLRHIYEKLQVHTKSEAVAKALRHGLTR
ncbi:MAG TPA: response regulator transcription factor [Pyrinomonadaceae bacterium]|jgi:DNA-binding NarL/FixJ family response regulator|nr:response regulator transcription factor [Pyrinomonadaceae bacterium]